ncbi:MAG: ATP-binding cassette domain-containing protein [Lachnospiraceae bacterium]|nr:ATP-binding cassette domain-containing protein [Lachnospiraceae bacterium]
MSLSVNIKKRLGKFLLDVQFEGDSGVTCLLGASGCGKSMTLKCIAGIEKPDEGRIVLDGKVLFDSKEHINLPPQKREVGYLFQNYALFPNMTVRQNILCGLHGEKDRERKEARLSEALRMMELSDLKDHKPAQLSGGQQQRAALARILVSDPKLLLLDEPFSALDGHLRDSIKLQLRDVLNRFGRDVVMVTHNRDEAYNMSRQIAVMEDGHMLTQKPTKELFADPESVSACILTGCKNIAKAEKAGEYLVDVPDWGIVLKTGKPVKDGLKAVGIRAHSFSQSETENGCPVCFVEEMEEPFETILQFRFQNQKEGTAPVWWRVSKEARPKTFPDRIGVKPEKLLLLYK